MKQIADIDLELLLQFEKEMVGGIDMLKSEYDYVPTYYLKMIDDYGALKTAQNLLKSPLPQGGLKTLAKRGCLQHSVEQVVCRRKYASLFTDQERANAIMRLRSLNYEPVLDCITRGRAREATSEPFDQNAGAEEDE